ncbi:hypothetical protein F4775DRAFT_555259 [Biscogniauxia sp. FL1348]|nr:hypothetical protein F4775DRAFT_555259 [Biscogniauxia sp. FL1348]
MSSEEEPSPGPSEPTTPITGIMTTTATNSTPTPTPTPIANANASASASSASSSPISKPRTNQIRPKGVHTKHLTELERFRVRTLYYDACMTKRRILEVTGYSESQIRTAVRAKSFEIGKRTGRPRKGYKILGPAVGDQDGSPGNGDGDPEDTQGTYQHDTLMSIDEEVQGQLLANALQSPGPAPSSSSSSSRPRGFSDLPPELRVQIWKLVMSVSSASAPPLRRTWCFVTQPSAPWLYLDTSYAAEALRNPPWSQYIQQRHGPAMALCHVNREARRAVLEAFTPIVTAAPTSPPGAYFKPMPSYVWVDLAHDHISFFGATPYSPDMFGKARRSALPAVWWRS